MSETTELKTSVDVEVRGTELLNRMTRELEAFIAKAKQAVAATSGKVAGRGTDITKGQEKANDAVRRGLGLRVEAERQRSDTAKAERADVIRLDSDAVRMFRMKMRMQRDQAREAATSERARETAARTVERQAERASRAVEAAAVRRQRVEAADTLRREREARSANRERERADTRNERVREAAVRRAIGLDNYRFRLRERYQRQEAAEHDREGREITRRGREALRRGRDGYNGITRPAGAAAVIGMGAAAAGVRRVLGAEGDVDAAEIGTRQYGGLSAREARALRDNWAAPTAEAFGVSPEKPLTAWTDATKLGIPTKDAQGFAELAIKTSEAWSVPFETVTDTLGTVNSLLTAKGDPFSLGRMQSVANALQHLAAKQSTTPEKLISFLQRGAGGADVLGMSMESGLAFGSASTSLGNQAGQSGRMLDYLAGRIVDMPRLARKKGEQGDQARDLMRRLGYGSAEAMDRARRADPDGFLPDFMERFARIKDTKKQDQAIKFFAGQEWLGEFGRMVKGADTYREAQKLAKEAKGFDAIGEVWNLHKLKLTFVAKQFGAGWRNILGEFGKELSPIARQAGDFFLEWTSKLRSGGLKDRFRALLDGLLKGLGVKNFPELLRNIFSDPKDATGGNIEVWKAAARGFGEGIRDVVGTIMGVGKLLIGGDADPKKLGRLAAQVLGFGLALVTVAPFAGILGAIGSALMGLAFAAGMAWKVLRGLGVVGATGAGAGAGAGAAGAAAGAAGAKGGRLAGLGRLFGLYGAAEAAREFGVLQAPDASKGLGRAFVEALDPGLASRIYGDGKGPDDKQTPSNPWSDLEDIRKSLAARDPALAAKLFPDGAVVQPQSFTDGDDWRGLIHRTALDGDIMPNDREWQSAGRDLADGFLDRARRGLGIPSGDGAPATGRATEALERMARSTKAFETRMRFEPLNQALDRMTGASSAQSDANGSRTSGISPSDPAQRYGRRFFSIPGNLYGGGGGVTDPRMSGDVAARAKAAHDFFRSKGLSEEATAGILASMKKESNFTPNARGDGGRAHGLFQHHADRRAAIMAATGINMSTASFDRQLEGAWWEMNSGDAGAQRALRALRTPGITARQAGAAFVQHFERPARDERGERGALAEGMLRQFGGGSGTSAMPGREQYEGLRLKSLEAIAGGAVAQGVTDLARQAQTDLPGGVARFTAFNDAFHHRVNPRSLHTRGLAFDTALSDPAQHVAAAEAMRAKLRAAGLSEDQFRVIDEYAKLSRHGTGGHIHTQFTDAEAAKRYHDFLGATPEMIAKAKEGRGKAVIATPDDTPPSDAARAMVRNVPLPPQRPAGLGGAGGQGAGGVVVHNHINGWEKSPKEIADMAQKATTEAWNHRAHDLEAELT